MIYNIKKNLKILVIGDVMIDHYIHGICNRISPEAPVPVVEIITESYTLGGAGNVLKNLISLDCQSDIISVMGDDANAAIVLRELSTYNISGDGIIKDPARCTIMKSRVLATNHQLIRLDRENVQPLNSEREREILKYLEKAIRNYDMVLISDYNKGLLTASLLKEILTICRNENIQSMVDPKGHDFSKYLGVNIIKPNKKEAALATGIAITDMDSLKNACRKIKDITGCTSVVITMSEEGMASYSNDELHIIPTKGLDVVDVTGAGDTVLASLGVSLASGNSLMEACDFANHAAAIVVSKVGSATVTIDEINSKI
jgi:rfaE bifunctional protein kinase chain/domain